MSRERDASSRSTNGMRWKKMGRPCRNSRKKLQNDFSFMSYAPFLFISAKTGQRVEKLYELIHYVGEQNAMRHSHRAAE